MSATWQHAGLAGPLLLLLLHLDKSDVRKVAKGQRGKARILFSCALSLPADADAVMRRQRLHALVGKGDSAAERWSSQKSRENDTSV